MELQRQYAAHGPLGFAVIRQIYGLLAVDELLQVIAFGNDHVLVPVPLLNRGSNSGGIPERADDLFLVLLVPDDLLAAQRHDAAHTFLVENARVARPRLHVRLVAAHHPIRRVKNLAAVLDAGVGKTVTVTRREFEGAAQLEVARGAVSPDQERVSLGWVLGGGLAGDGAVFDGP